MTRRFGGAFLLPFWGPHNIKRLVITDDYEPLIFDRRNDMNELLRDLYDQFYEPYKAFISLIYNPFSNPTQSGLCILIGKLSLEVYVAQSVFSRNFVDVSNTHQPKRRRKRPKRRARVPKATMERPKRHKQVQIGATMNQ